MGKRELPCHVAIIMDGNGRWAKARNLPRTAGHQEGEKTVISTIEACLKKGIKVLSLFAFSTENWNRDKNEVDTLFNILRKFMQRFLSTAKEKGVRITVMGDVSKLPQDVQISIRKAQEDTAQFGNLIVNIGLNYGGRAEIVRACNMAIKEGKEISEEEFSRLLYTSSLPDPDLIIRTSGEERLSNFMIYQSAYSELYFTDVLWPDFTESEFEKALDAYSMRNRRFGKA